MAANEIDVTNMTGPEFEIALMGAPSGQIFTYHRGGLVRARQRDRAVKELAMAAWGLSEAGWADLTQKRIRGYEGEFEYRATKRETVYDPWK